MRITLRSGGIIRSGPERELIDDYLKRANGLTRNTGFQSVSEDQIDLKKEKSRAEETHKLLPDLPASTCRVILDERGKSVSSRDIAKYLARARDDGYSECVFVIGGADGFEPAGIPAGTQKWSFGVQTWPHKLVRVMLAEQVYRALSILAGSPYHRD